MFSVTNTGTCFRPSCTANVCPTKSGVTVERRLQVLMSFFSPDALSVSTFFIRWPSTKNPFLRLRAIKPSSYGRCTFASACYAWSFGQAPCCPIGRRVPCAGQPATSLHHHHVGGRVGS